MKMYIVITRIHPRTGCRTYGPFKSFDRAYRWASRDPECLERGWDIAEVLSPER